MTIASKAATSRLPDVVGAEHVSSDAAELSAYAIDGKLPSVIVRPCSVEEVVEIVKYAAAEKFALIASGARTKLGIGSPPARYDIALDMTRLNRIIAYDPGDLTLSVQAGVSLREVAKALAEHRQFLPLAVPFFDRATVGGTIASGVDTPLRQFYGTARDYVLGMEFVLGEGVRSKSGGNVVKNVTGYDLHKLMIGSLGTLGAITRVNFKTFPMPVASRGLVATFENLDRAIEMRNRVVQSRLTPMTFDLLSPRVTDLFSTPGAERLTRSAMPAGVLSPGHWALTIGYSGKENVLLRYEAELRRMAAESAAGNVTVLGDRVRALAFAFKREFIPIALESSPATTIVKISVLSARLKDALAAAIKAADTNQLPWAAMARSLGVIYFALLPADLSQASHRQVVAATNQILAAGASLGANLTIPWCPSEWKSALKIWGPERHDLAQMQKVKKVFDPVGIFSPGRFIGGI
ncbi:MAG: FAD-binding oxidoreductase [Candidatus Acidiferrales bacterium]